MKEMYFSFLKIKSKIILKSTVESIIKEAGKILISYYGTLLPHSIHKKAAHDFVTEADNTSEKFITSELKKHFPEIPILAEETGYSSDNTSEYKWIIDPLDGTKNFIHSIPYFCISIGLEKNNSNVFGMVYAPLQNELFYAEKGKGAFLNDKLISVSPLDNFSESFISTGFPFKSRENSAHYFNTFQSIFSNVTNVRRCGAAALDLAYVACGRYDGFWELGLSPWDISAGICLIEEAGGKVTDFYNSSHSLENGTIIAGNTLVHKNLYSHIHENFK